ncbi:uncharacterized protein MELLADRAFT_117208 [Melampsora larici-populina 98AG31]|uniref:Uncharacterized protein n=1 Tax=Melampsora larici-populina (strain 98AG31 / pathotype 3-4-7) TaxID=747676 RepID=F4RUP9_MELLP|nr:uncharacterized protein MELLADRAFT_117208 [Melampsora larici-populina 98AG31]EGG03884.1 hypothetical protein MELLADRAFT_117208 [Melampsora larici-populina 98AG31]
MGRTIPYNHYHHPTTTTTTLPNRLIIKLEHLLTDSLKSCSEEFIHFSSHRHPFLNRFSKPEDWNFDNFLIGLESTSTSTSKQLMDRWVRNIVLASATASQSEPNPSDQPSHSTSNSIRPSSESTHQPNSLFPPIDHSDQIPESLQWSHAVPPPIGSSSSISSYNPLATQEGLADHPRLPSGPEAGQSDSSLWPTDPPTSWHHNLPPFPADHLQAYGSPYTRHILSSVQGDLDHFIQRMYQHPRPSQSNPTATTTTSDAQDHPSRPEPVASTASPPSLGLDPPVPARTQRISVTLPGVRSILSATSPEALSLLSHIRHPSSPLPASLTDFPVFPEPLGLQSYPSQLTEADILHMGHSNLFRSEDEDENTDLHPSLSYDPVPLIHLRPPLSHQPGHIPSPLDDTVPSFDLTPDTPSPIDPIADSVSLRSQLSPSSDELHITLHENMENPDSRASERPSPSLTSDFDHHTTRARATSRITRLRSQQGRSLSEHTSPEPEEDISTTPEGSQRRRKRSRTAPLVTQDLSFADPSSSPASTSNAAPTTADIAEEAARNSNPHRALPAFYSQDPQILTPEMTISIDTDPMTRRQIILDHSTHGPIRWHNASQKAIYDASKDGLVGEEIGQIRFSYLSIPPRERHGDGSTREASQGFENPEESSTSRATTDNHYLRSFYLTSGEWGPPTSSTSFRESLEIRPSLFSWGRRAMAPDGPPPPPLPTSSSTLDPMGSSYLQPRVAHHYPHHPHHTGNGRLYRSSTFARLPPIINGGGGVSSSSRRMRREAEEFMLPPLLPRPPPPPFS